MKIFALHVCPWNHQVRWYFDLIGMGLQYRILRGVSVNWLRFLSCSHSFWFAWFAFLIDEHRFFHHLSCQLAFGSVDLVQIRSLEDSSAFLIDTWTYSWLSIDGRFRVFGFLCAFVLIPAPLLLFRSWSGQEFEFFRVFPLWSLIYVCDCAKYSIFCRISGLPSFFLHWDWTRTAARFRLF